MTIPMWVFWSMVAGDALAAFVLFWLGKTLYTWATGTM